MPVVHGNVADCPSRSSPEWAAQKEFALLTLVAEQGTSKTKKLFMQKQRIITLHHPAVHRWAAQPAAGGHRCSGPAECRPPAGTDAVPAREARAQPEAAAAEAPRLQDVGEHPSG